MPHPTPDTLQVLRRLLSFFFFRLLWNSTTAWVLDDVRVMTKLGLQGRIGPYCKTRVAPCLTHEEQYGAYGSEGGEGLCPSPPCYHIVIQIPKAWKVGARRCTPAARLRCQRIVNDLV